MFFILVYLSIKKKILCIIGFPTPAMMDYGAVNVQDSSSYFKM